MENSNMNEKICPATRAISTDSQTAAGRRRRAAERSRLDFLCVPAASCGGL